MQQQQQQQARAAGLWVFHQVMQSSTPSQLSNCNDLVCMPRVAAQAHPGLQLSASWCAVGWCCTCGCWSQQCCNGLGFMGCCCCCCCCCVQGLSVQVWRKYEDFIKELSGESVPGGGWQGSGCCVLTRQVPPGDAKGWELASSGVVSRVHDAELWSVWVVGEYRRYLKVSEQERHAGVGACGEQ
jgi:hypothetical protein